MTDHDSRRPAGDRAEEHRPSQVPWWRSAAVLAPVAALIIGLVLGAVIVGAGQSSRSPDATATVTVTPSADPSNGDTSVVIPEKCVEAAETVEEATAALREGVAAVRDFSRDRLVELLNELEDLEAQAREEAAACSEVDVTGTTDSTE